MIDPFLIFYFKFILPAQKTINSGGGEHYFEKAILPTWKPWLGYAFERFCKRYAMLIASKMGFADSVLLYGPQFTLAPNGFQFDLVFERSDQVITVCEIKFNDKPVDTSVVKEMEDKLKKFSLKKCQMLEKAIITKNGVSEPILKLQYFHPCSLSMICCRFALFVIPLVVIVYFISPHLILLFYEKIKK